MKHKWSIIVDSDSLFWGFSKIEAYKKKVSYSCDVQFQHQSGNLYKLTYTNFWHDSRAAVYDWMQEAADELRFMGVDVILVQEEEVP